MRHRPSHFTIPSIQPSFDDATFHSFVLPESDFVGRLNVMYLFTSASAFVGQLPTTQAGNAAFLELASRSARARTVPANLHAAHETLVWQLLKSVVHVFIEKFLTLCCEKLSSHFASDLVLCFLHFLLL